MYSDELSDRLRTSVQPLVRFRQFCDAKLAKGKKRGDTFNWNIYGDTTTAGGKLNTQISGSGAAATGRPFDAGSLPETDFTITRGSGTISEFGVAVPFTEKLDNLSLHPVTEVIEKVLKNDAAKAMDREVHDQFFATNLVAVGSGAGSSVQIDTTTDGTPHQTQNTALETGHVKLIADELSERNIPAYDGTNYCSIFRPRALRTLKDQLESIHQYTSEGWYVIMNGERGRYEGVRFVEQTNIPQPIAYNSSTAPQGWKTADTSGARGQGYFFGADTVIEAVTVPEEIRAKIPTNYGLSRGIAWYALLGFAIVHNQSGATQNRIIRWDSEQT